jgi:hypothetical protein
MASVTYEHVTKRFGDVTAVNDLDIQIAERVPGPGRTIRLRQVHRPALPGWPGGDHRGDHLDRRPRGQRRGSQRP